MAGVPPCPPALRPPACSLASISPGLWCCLCTTQVVCPLCAVLILPTNHTRRAGPMVDVGGISRCVGLLCHTVGFMGLAMLLPPGMVSRESTPVPVLCTPYSVLCTLYLTLSSCLYLPSWMPVWLCSLEGSRLLTHDVHSVHVYLCYYECMICSPFLLQWTCSAFLSDGLRMMTRSRRL